MYIHQQQHRNSRRGRVDRQQAHEPPALVIHHSPSSPTSPLDTPPSSSTCGYLNTVLHQLPECFNSMLSASTAPATNVAVQQQQTFQLDQHQLRQETTAATTTTTASNSIHAIEEEEENVIQRRNNNPQHDHDHRMMTMVNGDDTVESDDEEMEIDDDDDDTVMTSSAVTTFTNNSGEVLSDSTEWFGVVTPQDEQQQQQHRCATAVAAAAASGASGGSERVVYIPVEIILYILTFASEYEMRHVHCLVCKTWYAQAHHPLMYRILLERVFTHRESIVSPPSVDKLDRDTPVVIPKPRPILTPRGTPCTPHTPTQSASNYSYNRGGSSVAGKTNVGTAALLPTPLEDRVIRLCDIRFVDRRRAHLDVPGWIDWRTLYEQLRPSRWKLSRRKRCGEHLVVSPDGMRVKTNMQSEETNFSVQTTRCIMPRKNWFYLFEIKILENRRHNLAFGLADEHFKLRENFVGYPSMKQNTPSWSYSSNGMVRNGLGTHGNPIACVRYQPGDRIGFLVDMLRDNESITFFKNGKPVPGGRKLPLQGLNRDGRYWPTITLYSRSDEVEVCRDISISFWTDIYPLLTDHQGQQLRALSTDDDSGSEEEDEEMGDGASGNTKPMGGLQLPSFPSLPVMPIRWRTTCTIL